MSDCKTGCQCGNDASNTAECIWKNAYFGYDFVSMERIRGTTSARLLSRFVCADRMLLYATAIMIVALLTSQTDWPWWIVAGLIAIRLALAGLSYYLFVAEKPDSEKN